MKSTALQLDLLLTLESIICKVTQKNIYIFDFEYSGLDDIAKILANFILQPNYPLNPDQENFFLELVSAKFSHTLDIHWLSRFQLLKPLFSVKWSLIMLNQLKTGTLDKYQLAKAQSYFQRNKCTYS